MTVLHPSFPLDVLADLAVAILNRNACEWSFRGELLDPITCFNIVAMEGREASEFKILMAGGEEKQRYLLMVEQNRLFKVVQLEKGQHKLQEASFAEIADEVYLEEIAKMRTLAVLHRLQFITFPRFCKGIYPLSSAGLAKVGPNCYSRLLYYDWKLSQLSFRAEITINAQI